MPSYRKDGILGLLGNNPALIFVIGSIVLLMLGFINNNTQAITLAYIFLFLGLTLQLLLSKRRM